MTLLFICHLLTSICWLCNLSKTRAKLKLQTQSSSDDITPDRASQDHIDERQGGVAYCAVPLSVPSHSLTLFIINLTSVCVFLYVVAARVRATEMRELLWLGIHYLRGDWGIIQKVSHARKPLQLAHSTLFTKTIWLFARLNIKWTIENILIHRQTHTTE